MKHHIFPSYLVLPVILFVLNVGVINAAEPADVKLPNVILIYSDDQGAVDLGCYGTADIRTPCLDALAGMGTRFTQMYAPAPVCSASRAGLMTGKIPIRAGAPGNFSSTAGVPGMSASETTMAEIFRAAGYATGHFGKWHLGYTPETMPLNQGFDMSYGHMGGCIDNYSHHFYWDGPNRHDLWKNGVEVFEPGEYFPQRMTDECIGFIEANREKPFFIYLAYNVPHYPLQPTKAWHERYKSIAPLDVLFVKPARTDGDNMPQLDSLTVRGTYCAFVSSMDEQIGRVLETLDRAGLRENTIVVFQADQGHSFEERTFYGGGYAGNFRGGKFSLFEGGIRVPSIISWPAGLPKNRVCDEMAYACDWYPTLAELCGVSVPNRSDLDGMSIAGCLSEYAPSPHDSLYWQSGNQWVVRKGNWKLYANPQDPSSSVPIPEKDAKLFLSNLNDDPGERSNLVEQRAEIVEELLTLQKRFQARIDDKPSRQ